MKCSLMFITFAAIMLLATIAVADVPQMINYQGRLTDDQGNPLDTTVSMTFAIYTDPETDDSVWSETFQDVSVVDGLFNVPLGLTNPIPADAFDSAERYLGVQVGDDSEITPRTQLVSVAYSYNADKLDGYEAQDIIDMIPSPGSPNGEFLRFGEAVGGEVLLIESSTLTREITNISLSANIGSVVDLRRDGVIFLRAKLSPETNLYYIWSKGTGAGIIIQPEEVITTTGGSGVNAYVTVTGFEY